MAQFVISATKIDNQKGLMQIKGIKPEMKRSDPNFRFRRIYLKRKRAARMMTRLLLLARLNHQSARGVDDIVSVVRHRQVVNRLHTLQHRPDEKIRSAGRQPLLAR